MQTTGIKSFYYFKTIEIPYTPEHNYEIGDWVIFLDEEKQEEIGIIVFVNRESKWIDNIMQTGLVLRKATANDIQKHETNEERNCEAFDICKEKIEKHNLNMHLVKVNYSFNGTRMNFTFTAEQRVDFRELVKDLAKLFKKQIHLQQIGPRDRARVVHGMGKCGQQTCCTRYLTHFESITMDMVRTQNLENRGSEKLSGQCGKLLCCLKYEVEQYENLKKELPQVGSIIKSKESSGKVLSIDVLNQKIRLELPDQQILSVSLSDVITV